MLFTLYVFPFKKIDVNDIDVVFDSHFAKDNSWEINSCIHMAKPKFTVVDYDYHSEMVDGKNILVIDRLGTRLSSSRNNVGYDNYLYFDTYYDGYRIA